LHDGLRACSLQETERRLGGVDELKSLLSLQGLVEGGGGVGPPGEEGLGGFVGATIARAAGGFDARLDEVSHRGGGVVLGDGVELDDETGGVHVQDSGEEGDETGAESVSAGVALGLEDEEVE